MYKGKSQHSDWSKKSRGRFPEVTLGGLSAPEGKVSGLPVGHGDSQWGSRGHWDTPAQGTRHFPSTWGGD